MLTEYIAEKNVSTNLNYFVSRRDEVALNKKGEIKTCITAYKCTLNASFYY